MDLPTRPTARPHRNHGLFSDHYLDHTLPGRPDWRALADEARLAMEEIARVFESYAPSENEAQTEEGLVKPVLRVLGHDFEVQPALATPDGTKRPDYVFYRDAGTLDANKNRTLNEDPGLPYRTAGVFSCWFRRSSLYKSTHMRRVEAPKDPDPTDNRPRGFTPFEDVHRDG
ncbi:MAG: hypothetical protein LC781_18530 [Actinobacteria bacterium]|nr:hypothetical protein [Actinomycetota bacterium]